MTTSHLAHQLHELEEILKLQGLNAALRFLSERVAHRFTAIYRLDKDDLQIVELIDKRNEPATAPLPRVPFLQSFCEVAVRDGSLATSNSALDDRLDARPNQGVLASYVGLPLMQPSGHLYGTLCHYDYNQQSISDDEFAFLQQAAGLLIKSL